VRVLRSLSYSVRCDRQSAVPSSSVIAGLFDDTLFFNRHHAQVSSSCISDPLGMDGSTSSPGRATATMASDAVVPPRATRLRTSGASSAVTAVRSLMGGPVLRGPLPGTERWGGRRTCAPAQTCAVASSGTSGSSSRIGASWGGDSATIRRCSSRRRPLADLRRLLELLGHGQTSRSQVAFCGCSRRVPSAGSS
jgi:hypothetical protein